MAEIEAIEPEERPKNGNPLDLLGPGLFAATDEQFQAFILSMRRTYPTGDALGSILLEQLLLATARVRKSAANEAKFGFADATWVRYHTLAERGFWKALNEWNKYQKTRCDVNNPASTPEDLELQRIRDERLATPVNNWPDRLALDATVSRTSPVLKGTGFTVEHFMALLADDWPEQQIWDYHPDITPEDLDACRACDAAGPEFVAERWKSELASQREPP